MNERIAELQTQCIVREVRGTTAFDSYMVDRFDTELFAKLIVRECIRAYNDDGYQTEYEQDLKVLKHFGVEE
jgi:hypothetical protein